MSNNCELHNFYTILRQKKKKLFILIMMINITHSPYTTDEVNVLFATVKVNFLGKSKHLSINEKL